MKANTDPRTAIHLGLAGDDSRHLSADECADVVRAIYVGAADPLDFQIIWYYGE